MKIQVRFIVNPISGVGKQGLIPELAKRVLQDAVDWEILYTTHKGHGFDLAQQAVKDQIDVVVAVGGDGSVNDIGKALVGSTTRLAIVPTGSGNGLARHLKIPLKLEQAINLILNHKTRRIDTAQANDHPFLAIAGVGFDAMIAQKFDTYGKRGFFSYLKIVLGEFMRYRSTPITFTSSAQQLQTSIFLLTIANSTEYGNRATISPLSSLEDGLLECCILRRFPLVYAPVIAFRLFNRSIHKSRYMQVVSCPSAEIEGPFDVLHVDGEPRTFASPLKISILPQTLSVIVPS